MSKINIWILTEERPKLDVLQTILEKIVARDRGIGFFANKLRILPILDANKRFTFEYEVAGLISNKINKIYLKTVSGSSSFVDYVVFCQDKEPQLNDVPSYLIEETKTSGKESRNTAVYQRITKFVYARRYYPDVPLLMLYRHTRETKENATVDFGIRLLKTLGVNIVGWKNADQKAPFTNVDELIESKNVIREKKGNVPLRLSKDVDANIISISGRLVKDQRLAHDPNIGAIAGLAQALRLLGWTGALEVVNHGLKQENLQNSRGNKFTNIASLLNVSVKDIVLPPESFSQYYWHYEKKGEKLGTIFIHLVVENFTSGYSIFENHAGCEKSYFVKSDGNEVEIEKYQDREKYKKGDKSQRLSIPDLILLDVDCLEIINIEGKTFDNLKQGLDDLNNYDAIETMYVKKYYPQYRIIRTLVLFGGKGEELTELKVGFWLNQEGRLILGIRAPKLFTVAVKNLLDYWKD